MPRDFSFSVALLGVKFGVFLVVIDLFFGECVGGDLCPSGGYFDAYAVVDADHGDWFAVGLPANRGHVVGLPSA